MFLCIYSQIDFDIMDGVMNPGWLAWAKSSKRKSWIARLASESRLEVDLGLSLTVNLQRLEIWNRTLKEPDREVEGCEE